MGRLRAPHCCLWQCQAGGARAVESEHCPGPREMFHVKHYLRWPGLSRKMFHVKQSAVIDAVDVAAKLAAAGVRIDESQAALLARHSTLVLTANQRMNLTRITDPEEVVALHIVDSLAFLPHAHPGVGRLLDMGSGAGFPGIPLAILGFDVTLCESVKKKAAFLQDVVSELGLLVNIEPLRAEELAVESRGAFSTVIARALSSLPALVELASPLLCAGGCLIAMKGRLESGERARADAAARLCGMTPASSVPYVLERGEERTVCVYVKSGKSSLRLPRRPGMAQKQPLGGDFP